MKPQVWKVICICLGCVPRMHGTGGVTAVRQIMRRAIEDVGSSVVRPLLNIFSVVPKYVFKVDDHLINNCRRFCLNL